MGDARTDDATVTAWALDAAAGDRAALAAFVRATQRDVHRFLVHINGAAGAEDLAQETYLRALRSLPRFAARASARTWLLSIARRVAVDQVRAAQARPRTTAVGDWDTVGRIGRTTVRPGPEERVALHDLVASLETDRREAFVLTQVLDVSYAEAAEICGCPVGTIRSRVARAREDLVNGMADAGRDEEAGS
jgi:RNA polymerase sigma-70 factor (ECF subfamily)